MKIKLFLISILLATDSFSLESDKTPRKLFYKYNDIVTIWITNEVCVYPELKERFPWFAVATREDGAIMPGCFNREDEDSVKIQWYGGDFSVFPANVFLIKPDGGPQSGTITEPRIEPTL